MDKGIDSIGRDELEFLSHRQDGPCVSIYMGTGRMGEAAQNLIRLKNLLRYAQEELVSTGLTRPEAERLLAPAWAIHDDMGFWDRIGEGLAIFASYGIFRLYRLPAHFDELVVVNARFHFKPLLPLLATDGQYFLLALAQKRTRLYRGTRDSLVNVTPEGMVVDLATTLRYDDTDDQYRMDTGGHDVGGRHEGAYYGHGEGTFDDKERLRRFCRDVAHGVEAFLRDSRAPLVLVANEALHPIYREVSCYAHLLPDRIERTPEGSTEKDLHALSWAVVEPHFQRGQDEALERCRALAGTGLVTTRLDEAVRAAEHGRVDTMLVALEERHWGAFDPATDAVVLHDAPESGDDELIDLAAFRTLANNGRVFALPRERLPEHGEVAAILRY